MRNSNELRHSSLCILLREDKDGKKVLLAMKKRGFGEGKWNGVGGKVDPDKGDRGVEDSAVRETREEIFVAPTEMKKAAIMDFLFPYVPDEYDFDQQVHVFLISDWEGEPAESEEMKPEWFREDEIPFDEMWPDDLHWLPRVLSGELVRAKFSFGGDDEIEHKELQTVKELE